MARLLIETLAEFGQCGQFLRRVSPVIHVHGHQPLLSLPNIRPCILRHASACICNGTLRPAPRLLKHNALERYTAHLCVQSFASLHEGAVASKRDALRRTNSSDDIVTFIKDDEDLERFLKHVTELLSTPDFSKVKIAKEDAESKVEELARRLTDMKAEPRNIYAFLRSNPRVLNTRWDVLMQNIQYLDELRLFGNRALLVLDRSPKIWNAGLELLQQRVRRLRKLGLTEGSLQRVITAWPGVLTLKKNRLNGSHEMLKKCQFSGRQITEIIISSPQVLDSEPADIEHRFQYVYFSMGLQSQADMVQANLFKYPLEHIQRRHLVLEKLGIYEMPNKQGKTRVDNPKLCRIVDCPDARFAEKCAGISLEEFQMFGRNLEEEARRKEDGEAGDETDEELVDYDDTRHR
ncbi:transcription termination factor 4, mitochondrial-like [Patiria miniata]|uniref:Uncharacterized protein n=1 Tax=Patiria miniata TaxID=46514 RepID=A0A914AQT6_PATMI|nr:transcription termination factor 4, mitochondrial-like [Patiria miniata]